jgi:hypothetical protein
LLGNIAIEEGQGDRERLDAVVPPGSPQELKRVEIAHQVVGVPRRPPSLRLSDADDAAESAVPLV